MREIKFRGQRTDNGDWAYGDLLKPNGSCRIVNYEYSPNEMGVCTDYHYFDVEEESVGLYTGLKDKNGKDIWEGDIVYINCDFESSSKFGVVEFGNGRFRLKVKDRFTKSGFRYTSFKKSDTFQDMGASIPVKYSYEVVGNVIDNKYLLNNKQ